MSSVHRTRVIGTGIDPLGQRAAVDLVVDWATARDRGRYVCFANAHVTTEARRDPVLRTALEAADVVMPDGAPVAWMLRRLGHAGQPRVSGPDLMLGVCDRAQDAGIGVFLYGSTPHTLDRLRHALEERYPRLVISGVESPPFTPPTQADLDDTAARIAATGAGIVFVGLGAPKQEVRMLALRGSLPAVQLGVGAAFDFHAGTVRRAPSWMREHGLEWLHRLAAEPRRLLGRYLLGNSRFVAFAANQLLRQRFGRTATR